MEDAVPPRPEQDRQRERHLCPSCVPWDRWNDPEVLTGCAALAAGALVLLLAPGIFGLTTASLLVLVGAVHLVWRLGRAHLRHRRCRDVPALRGLDPRIRRVQVVERITAEATLDDDLHYRSRVTDIRGSIKVDAQWGRAQAQRLEDVPRRRRGCADTSGSWSAGYLLLQGRPEVTVRQDADVEPASPTVLHLRAKESDHPALRSFASRADARWTIEAAYEIDPDRQPERFAVWVTPTMVPLEGQRSLDVEVHWRSLGQLRYERGPRMRKLDLIRVQVPGRWGPLESCRASGCDGDRPHPTPTVSAPDQAGLRTIEWRNVPVVRSSRGRHCVRLRFADAVDLVNDKVLAHVEARFAGALSGLAGIRMHHAGGAPRSKPRGVLGVGGGTLRAAPFTVVELDARLRLAGLRYEDLLSLPPQSGREGRELALAHSYPATVPEHTTVTRLADELSRAGYYVKRVAENPPRAGGQAMTVNHSWSVSGRLYDGVYPIDFEVALDGEEREAGGQVAGSTSATLHIRGAYTTEKMKRRVLGEWSTLWNHVDVALSGLRRADGVIGLPDQGSAPLDDLEHIFTLLQDGVAHGGISEAFAEKLMTLLRPADRESEDDS